jgi:hypothetical protein
VNALLETTRSALLEPSTFFRRMPASGGIGEPLVYALIVGCVGIVAQTVYSALFSLLLGAAIPTFGRYSEFSRAMAFAQGGLGLVLRLLVGPIVLLIVIFLSAGIFHLVLLLLGGAKRGFEATVRVVCYSNAASILLIVPFCGGLLSFVWGIVLEIIGLSEAHGISKGTAVAAVLIPIVVLACCCGGAVAIAMLGAASSLSRLAQ